VWLLDATAAEAAYGHISRWATGGVTDMSYLFAGASAFNQDIGGWAIDSVTSMMEMFEGASAFDQDLGWCVDDGVSLDSAFANTLCASTSCGVVQSSNCPPAPTPRPTPDPSPAPTPLPTPAQTLVKVASSVTLEGIVATEFNADEGMKAAFAQSILDSAKGAFDDVIDIEATGRRRLAAGAGVGVSYTGVARVVGT